MAVGRRREKEGEGGVRWVRRQSHLTSSYSSYPQGGGGGGGGRPPQIEEGNLTGAIGTQVNQLRICYRYLIQKCRCIVFPKIMGKRGLKAVPYGLCSLVPLPSYPLCLRTSSCEAFSYWVGDGLAMTSLNRPPPPKLIQTSPAAGDHLFPRRKLGRKSGLRNRFSKTSS